MNDYEMLLGESSPSSELQWRAHLLLFDQDKAMLQQCGASEDYEQQLTDPIITQMKWKEEIVMGYSSIGVNNPLKHPFNYI